MSDSEVHTTAMNSLPHALQRIDEIRERMGDRRPVFFLDYDGTLTPIVERPEDALMPPATREVIARLVAGHTVAMVSGRDVGFVREQVHVEGVLYAGSHGFDIVGPEGMVTDELGEFERFLPMIDEAERMLAEDLAGVEGAKVERKKYSVAAHYRLVAPDEVSLVTASVERTLEALPELRRGLGKKVYEVRPDVEWDKGKAVSWLFDALGHDAQSAFPFYMGDDITDEDAFAALQDIGLGIAVGDDERDTAASYRVFDTQEVAEFLSAMAGASYE